MKTALSVLALGVFGWLGACAAPPNPMDGPEQDIPQMVQDALPDDIPNATVIRDDQGCYAYTYAHSLIPLEDPDGQQICLP